MIPFNRDLVDYDQYSSYPPHSQPHLPRKSHSPSSHSTHGHFHPAPFNPVRHTTSPENIALLREEQLLVVKGSLSPYDQVRDYLDRFKDYSGAKIAPGLLEPYKRYPRFSYNSSISTLSIRLMPTSVYESITSTLIEGFTAAISTLPVPLRPMISAVPGQDFVGFGGRYRGSEKTPDLAVKFVNTEGGFEPKFILEAGFSESYDDLVRDAELWINGRNDVSAVLLVKFKETPNYQSPAPGLDSEGFEELGYPSAAEAKVSHFTFKNEYGPVVHDGLAWVGRVSAFLEVWKRDATTRLAVQDGGRIDLYSLTNPTQLGLRLSDFMTVGPENDRDITFNWKDYQRSLKEQIRDLAVYRYQKQRDPRLDNHNDPDYHP
ncbi:hypothetical protein FGG08_003364 [Glutinoglossum americanum]|uniref:Uncharacterized protein n=1 Tax=Glutinoglossum americanum TaxID=1670608 RepID=A0A9P8I2R1_9PEZI|nr:hypothetical protein FGG08_003364 [Glutinoglossum americanum]